MESEPLASYNSEVLVSGCCLEIVKEGGQFCFTEWFVTLSSLRPGGAASGLLSAVGVCGLYLLAAKKRLLCPCEGIRS